MLAQRKLIFRKFKLPVFTEDANIAPDTPLVQVYHSLEHNAEKEISGTSFGIVFHDEQLWLAQGMYISIWRTSNSSDSCRIFRNCSVLSIYTQSTGKSSAHSWVLESSNITAVSYIAAQLFQPIAPQQFSSTTRHAMGLKVSKFKLIKPTSFLTALSRSPSPLGQNIAISKEDQLYYKALEDMKHVVRQAVKELEAPIRKGRKKGVSLD